MNSNTKKRIIANATRKASTEALIPFATIYIANIYGSVITGFLISSILIGGTCFNYLGGILLKRTGVKNALILFEAFHIASMIFMYLSVSFDLNNAFILFYFVKNIFFSISLPSSEAAMVESSQTYTRKKAYTLNFWAISVVSPAFSIIGAYFFNINFKYVIIIAIMLNLTYLLLSTFHLENGQKSIAKKTIEKTSITENKPFFILWIGRIIICSVGFLFYTYFAIKSSNSNYWLFEFPVNGVDAFGYLKFIAAITPTLTVAFVFSKLESLQKNRFQPYLLLLWALLLIFLYYCYEYSFAINVAIVALSSIVLMVAEPAIHTAMVEQIPDEKNGVYYSSLSLTGRYANILASFMLTVSDCTHYFFGLLIFAAAVGSLCVRAGLRLENKALPIKEALLSNERKIPYF